MGPAQGSVDPPTADSPRDVTYEWSRDLIRRSVWRFSSRRLGRAIAAVVLLLLLGIASAMAGFATWMPWLFISVAIGVGLVWLRYYLFVTKAYDEMRDRRITVRIEPDTITFRSSEMVSTIKWSLIKQAWSFPDVMLLFIYGRTNYVTLPVAPIGEELRSYVVERIRTHGGKVT